MLQFALHFSYPRHCWYGCMRSLLHSLDDLDYRWPTDFKIGFMFKIPLVSRGLSANLNWWRIGNYS